MILRSPHTLFSSSIFMCSKHLLKCSPCEVTISSSSSSFSSFLLYHHLHTHCPPKPISKILPFASRFYSTVLSKSPTTVDFEVQVENRVDGAGLAALKQKLEQHILRCATAKSAENSRLMHPEAIEGVSASFGTVNHIDEATPYRKITEQGIGLEPLCEKLLEYFMERMITGETLRRNAVMQKSEKSGDGVAIAFTYRRNGVLVSCNYRNLNKVFWQEKNTERILYGLDDIKQVRDIIIVLGEIDKLSMEEAGFRNCVSVPDGAPPKLSNEDLPPTDEDTEYQYLWNCKEYFDKASRIILATDADQRGQALAEELVRRLGRERCWQVKWPMKNEVDVCKDANEVLICLGPHALREVIDQAELYPIRGELTLVYGVPNSGKSEWIDALNAILMKMKDVSLHFAQWRIR